VTHLLSKDEIKFEPRGKCKEFLIFNPDLKVELTYSTGTMTLNAKQRWWGSGTPITIKLPQEYGELQSFRLKGKFEFIVRLKKGAHGPPYTTPREMDENLETITGYKIDSTWNTK
jgi:hypothetical protein